MRREAKVLFFPCPSAGGYGKANTQERRAFMNYLQNRKGQSVLCLILSALLVWMLLPLGNLPQAQLRDPIGNDPLPPIGPLQLGEGDQTIPETVPSTEPMESQPPETTPNDQQETRPPETQPEETENPDETQPDTGDGDEGQEDGLQGEEGGEEENLDLALVMNWYRYGSQKTNHCLRSFSDGDQRAEYRPASERSAEI